MLIINTKPLEQGVYKVLKSNHITEPYEGWAYIPEDFVKPSTFPRLGSLEVAEITYPYEVEVEKEVTKYRDVEVIGEDGKTTIVQEEYTEKEMVKETREKVMLTVVGMTEGTLPDIPEEEPKPTSEERIAKLEQDVADTQDALCEQSATTEESIADIENAMCESEVLTDERLASIEDAICELSMLMA